MKPGSNGVVPGISRRWGARLHRASAVRTLKLDLPDLEAKVTRLTAVLLLLTFLAGCGERPPVDDDAADAGTPGDAALASADTAATLVATVDGLSGPEAVKYDPEQDVWFVANFGPEADDQRDGNGFIARVQADGTMDSLHFMVGGEGAPLHMPRGMALEGDTLWVADADGIHGFDRRTGQALAFIDFRMHEPGFLNDVTVGADGALYVTDTGRGRVYRAGGGAPTVAVEDSLTGPPNGITWDADRRAFLLAPWGGGQVIRSWAPESGFREVVTIPGGQFDGIEVVGGRIVAASQADSTIWVAGDGTPRPAVRVSGRPADIGVDPSRGVVAVPYIALDRVELWRVPGLGGGTP
jgi:sugar lactone lactonase YvrE